MRRAMLARKLQDGERFISVGAARALSFRGLVRLVPSEEGVEV